MVACTKDGILADGGIGGTGVIQGPITGFGSIIVNGIHFDVHQAEIDIDGMLNDEELLQPGMVVTIYGQVLNDTHGKAQRVVFEYNLKGIIDSIFADGSGFMAHGQIVRIDALTVFHGVIMENLTVGMPIYVSGITGGDGVLLARYLSNQKIITDDLLLTNSMPEFSDMTNKAPVSSAEFSGEVSALDTNQHQFTLGQQIIDYSAATFLNMNESQLANGLPILLKGMITTEVLIASEIKFHQLEIATHQFMKLHGLVSNFHGDGNFKLAGQRIIFNPQTQFIAGTVNDLAENISVTVDGIFTNNAVTAQRIAFTPQSLIRIAAPIVGIDGDNISLTNIMARVMNTTLMLDNSQQAMRHFTTANLQLGDAVIVHGYETAYGMELSRLERVDDLASQP